MSKRIEGLVKNADRWKTPILIGTPTLGKVRIEWHNAHRNMVLPVNWGGGELQVSVPVITPLRYHVAEAQNIIVKGFLEGAWEWLFLLEDDVIVPPDILIKFIRYAKDGRYPVISGLYNVKGNPPAPMIFRGRGTHAIDKGWKPGQKIMVDGVPTGCLLIARRLLQVCWDDAPEIRYRRLMADGAINEIITKEIFLTRREAGIDPETNGYYMKLGTSDLEWCDKVIDKGYLKKAGFNHVARKKYPFMIDTSIKCGHIDISTGVIY